MVVLGEAISQDLAFITFFLRNTPGGFSPVPPWSFLFEGPTSPWVWARAEGSGVHPLPPHRACRGCGHPTFRAPQSVAAWRCPELNRPLWGLRPDLKVTGECLLCLPFLCLPLTPSFLPETSWCPLGPIPSLPLPGTDYWIGRNTFLTCLPLFPFLLQAQAQGKAERVGE